MAYPLFKSLTPHKHCLAHNCLMVNATTAGVPRNCHRLCHHHLLHQCTLLLIILACKVLECVVDYGTPAIACTSPYHDETKLNNHEFVHITDGWNKPLTQPTSLDRMKNLKLKCGTPNSKKTNHSPYQTQSQLPMRDAHMHYSKPLAVHMHKCIIENLKYYKTRAPLKHHVQTQCASNPIMVGVCVCKN